MTNFLRYGAFYKAQTAQYWRQTPWNAVQIWPFSRNAVLNGEVNYQEGQDYIHGLDLVRLRGWNTDTNKNNDYGELGFVVGDPVGSTAPLQLDERIYFVPLQRTNEDRYLFSPF